MLLFYVQSLFIYFSLGWFCDLLGFGSSHRSSSTERLTMNCQQHAVNLTSNDHNSDIESKHLFSPHKGLGDYNISIYYNEYMYILLR